MLKVISFAALVLSALGSAGPAAPLHIVSHGRSAYSIYILPDAPQAVKTAAAELHQYVREATGADLPIVTAAEPPRTPFIGLGGSLSKRVGSLSEMAIPPDGFIRATDHGNLYIGGDDDGTEPGASGTRNGVGRFLQDFVGVRWLMPGHTGVDVPTVSDVTVPEGTVIDAPVFTYRRVPYIQENAADVKLWAEHLGLGGSLRLNHPHNWTIFGAADFVAHPEWFAAKDGVRVPPAGDRYKLETTNPELVRAFAQKAIDAFRRDPNLRSFSLSPNDSAGWSDSPESRAFYDTDPHGGPSVTPLVLQFYNDVARIVGKEFPDRVLCGYVYAQYLYPPSAGIPKMEPNVCLVLAPDIDYGFQLYRDDRQQDFAALVRAWSQAARTTAYYDLPDRLVDALAAPTPAAPDILQRVFSTVADAGMMGAYVYGIDDWGFGAPTNYLAAQLMWNPHADANALLTDFYRRAYGPRAGALMEQLNGRLAAAFRSFYRAHDEARYSLTPAMLREIYVPLYPDIERTYLKALTLTETPEQRKRLEMYGRALIIFRWNLHHLGIILDTNSPLAVSDEGIATLLDAWKDDLATSPAERGGVREILKALGGQARAAR